MNNHNHNNCKDCVPPPPPPPPGGGINPHEEQERPKSVQKENKRLKGEIRGMEMKIKAMQVELTKSYGMKDKLEGLCRELQKQNKYIKAESAAKIKEASTRGKELASEVENNMGFMKSINDNLTSISAESMVVKKENEELAKKIGVLRGHYEEREQILQEALKETADALEKAHLELAQAKLQNVSEKERLVIEVQKLGDSLVQARDQVKEAKEIEVSLRQMLQGYDDKFKGLQQALKDTNGSYEEFRTEMLRVNTKTKQLEGEAVKWQQRWEESNNSLQRVRENYLRVYDELNHAAENLEKMKQLCRTLHSENRELQEELKGRKGGGGEGEGCGTTPLSPSAEATLASIKVDNVLEKKVEDDRSVDPGKAEGDPSAKPEVVEVKVEEAEATPASSEGQKEEDGKEKVVEGLDVEKPEDPPKTPSPVPEEGSGPKGKKNKKKNKKK